MYPRITREGFEGCVGSQPTEVKLRKIREGGLGSCVAQAFAREGVGVGVRVGVVVVSSVVEVAVAAVAVLALAPLLVLLPTPDS